MFRWLGVVGDTIFAAGAVALAIFVIGLRTGGSTGRRTIHAGEPGGGERPIVAAKALP